MRENLLSAGESGIEYLHIKALLPQMRANVEEAQGDIGLEDLPLFGILIEKVTVGE
jgi:hypothetical protein